VVSLAWSIANSKAVWVQFLLVFVFAWCPLEGPHLDASIKSAEKVT